MNITRKGVETPVVGIQPAVGQAAPHFALKNLDDKVISNDDLKGRTVLLSVFPDINTSVCDRQTREFFKIASTIPDVRIINVSNNSKETLEGWCATNGIETEMLIDEHREFADAYGLWMPEFEVLARSVFIIDPQGILVYSEIVPEMSHEPDYDAVIAAAQNA